MAAATAWACSGATIPIPTRLEVPREQIAGLRHDEGDDGLHQLTLLLPGGPDLVLERGPCPIIADQALQYRVQLGLPVEEVVDATCPGHLDEVRAWAEEQAARVVVEHVTEVPNVAGIQVTDRRGQDTTLSATAEQSWTPLRPMLGHCFTLDDDSGPRAEVRLVINRDGTLRSARVRKSGSSSVDRCLEAQLQDTLLPPQERPVKLVAEVSNPRL